MYQEEARKEKHKAILLAGSIEKLNSYLQSQESLIKQLNLVIKSGEEEKMRLEKKVNTLERTNFEITEELASYAHFMTSKVKKYISHQNLSNGRQENESDDFFEKRQEKRRSRNGFPEAPELY